MYGSATELPSSERKSLALRLLRESLKALRYRFGVFVFGTVVIALVALLPPRFFLRFTEGVQKISSETAPQFLHDLVIFGVLIGVCLLISAIADSLLREWLRLHVEANLRRRVLRRIHEVPLEVLDGAQRGDWLTRVTSDLDHVELFFTDELPKQVRHLAVLLGSGAFFIFYTGRWATLPLASALFLGYLHVRVQRRLTPILAEIRALHGGVFQMLLESLEGLRTIRSHAVEPFVQRRFESKLSQITRNNMRAVRVLGVVMGGTELISQVLITACLTAGAWALSQDHLSVGQILIYPFFLGLFYSSAQALASSAYDWNRFFIEGGRIGEILYDSRISTPPYRFQMSELQECTGLEVQGLEVGFDGSSLTAPLNFFVGRGEIWAIVGPSGSGKSTFLEVLAGLRPALRGQASLISEEGRVLWQSSQFSIQIPLGPCAYVEQHPYLFEGSLRDNLTFGNPNRLSDVMLWHYLERVGLSGFLRKKGGLEFLVKDRGQNLSEGERFRIALSRALLLNRPFLLLDEPFSALDKSAVEIVITALEAEKEECGIVLVSHYLPESLSADGILDFEAFEAISQPGSGTQVFERIDPPMSLTSP